MEELLTKKLAEMKTDLCNFFQNEIKELCATVNSIETNQQYVSDSYEEIKLKLEEILAENQQIRGFSGEEHLFFSRVFKYPEQLF